MERPEAAPPCGQKSVRVRSAVRRGIVVAASSNTNPSPVRGDIMRGSNPDDAAPERGWENHLGACNYRDVAPTALTRLNIFDSPTSLKPAAASTVPGAVRLRESSARGGGCPVELTMASISWAPS
jgi:hypothetical protein